MFSVVLQLMFLLVLTTHLPTTLFPDHLKNSVARRCHLPAAATLFTITMPPPFRSDSISLRCCHLSAPLPSVLLLLRFGCCYYNSAAAVAVVAVAILLL